MRGRRDRRTRTSRRLRVTGLLAEAVSVGHNRQIRLRPDVEATVPAQCGRCAASGAIRRRPKKARLSPADISRSRESLSARCRRHRLDELVMISYTLLFVLGGCLLGAIQLIAGMAIGMWVRRPDAAADRRGRHDMHAGRGDCQAAADAGRTRCRRAWASIAASSSRRASC